MSLKTLLHKAVVVIRVPPREMCILTICMTQTRKNGAGILKGRGCTGGAAATKKEAREERGVCSGVEI